MDLEIFLTVLQDPVVSVCHNIEPCIIQTFGMVSGAYFEKNILAIS